MNLIGLIRCAQIAHLGGYDVFEPATCNLAFAALTGESAIAATELSSDESVAPTKGPQQVAQAVGQEQLQRALAAAGKFWYRISYTRNG